MVKHFIMTGKNISNVFPLFTAVTVNELCKSVRNCQKKKLKLNKNRSYYYNDGDGAGACESTLETAAHLANKDNHNIFSYYINIGNYIILYL